MNGTVSRLPAVPAWEGRLLGLVAVTLSFFGVAAVYGASSIQAVQSGQPGATFALRQMTGLLFGVPLMLICSRIDYQTWRRYAWPLLAVAMVLLAVPFVPGIRRIAPEVNGARRWVNLGLFSVQPSELAMLAGVLWVSMLAAKKGEMVRQLRRGVMPFVLVMLPVAGLIALEPDFSAALQVFLLTGVILFAAGGRIGHFLLLGLVSVPIAWHEVASAQYRLARVLTFLSPGADIVESNWQIRQSLIGVGSGRLFGVGFGQGTQKLGYLPYAYSDFIFSTIGEEWGFLGVALVVGLFAVFIAMGFRVARGMTDRFGMLLATGLVAMIGGNAVLHMAVTFALVPTTGLPLPFVSAGRSSLLVALIATGILINIANNRGRAAVAS